MNIKAHNYQKQDYQQLKELYEVSFPINELRPLEPILEDRSGCSQIIMYTLNSKTVGFAMLLNTSQIAHIIYIAVASKYQNQGIGTEILKDIRKGTNKTVLVDVEVYKENQEDSKKRKSRIQFYKKNNFEQSGVFYPWRGEDFMLMYDGKTVEEKDFRQFWQEVELMNSELLIY